MDNTNSFEREEKKKRLRSNILENVDTDGRSPEEEDTYQEDLRRARMRRLRRGLILLILFAAAAAGWRYYRKNHLYAEYTVAWEKEIPTSEGSFTAYRRFGENVLKYTKDGASYIDGRGNIIWSISYEMKAPVVEVNGDFAVIADQQGNRIYICDKTGCKGEASSSRPILRASVSAYGVVAVLSEESAGSYVSFFKQDGSELDWAIRTAMSGNGYLMDVSLSPDGSQVMLSDVYIGEGVLGSRVLFYNFSEYGKSYPNRLVGGFDEFGTALVPRVRFLTDRRACAVANGSIGFFSLENVTSPELTKMVTMSDEIRGVAFSDRYVAVVTSDSSGEHDSRLHVYSVTGQEVSDTGFTYAWQDIAVDGDFVILRRDEACRIIGVNGKERFDGEFEFGVSVISRGSRANSLLMTGGNTVREIRLK